MGASLIFSTSFVFRGQAHEAVPHHELVTSIVTIEHRWDLKLECVQKRASPALPTG